MKRIIIAGSRKFENYDLVASTMKELLKGNKESVEIISGHAAGADTLGERFAGNYGYPKVIFQAKWDLHGKLAGPIRNQKMAEYARANNCKGILVAFWDGKSTGTKSMIEIARKYHMEVHIINIEKE